jgi:hypothetical protein
MVFTIIADEVEMEINFVGGSGKSKATADSSVALWDGLGAL